MADTELAKTGAWENFLVTGSLFSLELNVFPAVLLDLGGSQHGDAAVLGLCLLPACNLLPGGQYLLWTLLPP